MTVASVPYITYSAGADALYIAFADETVSWTEELDHRRMVDRGSGDRVLGIEFLDVSDGIDLTGVPERERVEKLLRVFTFPVIA